MNALDTAVRAGRVAVDGHRFVYDEYGTGDRVVILLHGLLFSRRMDSRLGAALAGQGLRVICLDQLGHGESDRPREPWVYSLPLFARYVVGAMDELGIADAVIAGRSLGANTALEVAVLAPQRVRGLVAEAPVLEGARWAAMTAFGPVMIASSVAAPVLRLAANAARRVPRGDDLMRDMLLDVASADPAANAALLRGLMFSRVAPFAAERAAIEAPALVLGYPRDPLHRASEVRRLLGELPGSRYLELRSMYELHTAPQRLAGPIAEFVEECWAQRVGSA